MRTILTRSKLFIPALAIAAATLGVAACGGDEAGGDGGGAEVTVVATTTQVADLARNVVGERGEVVGMLAANADPHDYEPRPSDAEALAGADLVLESGGDLDLWIDGVVDASGSDAPVVTMLDAVETIEGGHEHAEEDGGDHADAADEHAEEDEHAEGDEHGEEDEHAAEGEHADAEIDPHWWQSPANAILAVEAIRDALIEVDPEGRAEYEANADAYGGELEDLDATIAECMQAIPDDARKLVTSHDALGYFADRYEIEVVGAAIPALTTQAQPSAGETAELVELIRDEGVVAVFPEAGVASDLEQAIADDAGATIGGELWADALGPAGSGAETYLDAIAANADTIASGFSGGERGC